MYSTTLMCVVQIHDVMCTLDSIVELGDDVQLNSVQ